MASLMEELTDVLQKEDEQYQALIKVSTEKKDVIIAGNVKRLEELTEQEQEMTDILHQYEVKRRTVLNDMADVLGKEPESFTISTMIEALSAQPEEQSHLILLRDNLRRTLQEMVRINTQNQALIQQSLEMVEFDLTLFKSLRQAPETANYNKSAYNTGDLLGSSGFDAKQ